MKNFFTTKRLCRAGIIAALYVALTYAFAPFAFGPFQIRPAEALCILPVFFPEAVPALYIGCMLSNLASPYFVFDVFLGSLATLLAALASYLVGRFLKKEPFKMLLCGFFPVFFNALINDICTDDNHFTISSINLKCFTKISFCHCILPLPN